MQIIIKLKQTIPIFGLLLATNGASAANARKLEALYIALAESSSQQEERIQTPPLTLTPIRVATRATDSGVNQDYIQYTRTNGTVYELLKPHPKVVHYEGEYLQLLQLPHLIFRHKHYAKYVKHYQQQHDEYKQWIQNNYDQHISKLEASDLDADKKLEYRLAANSNLATAIMRNQDNYDIKIAQLEIDFPSMLRADSHKALQNDWDSLAHTCATLKGTIRTTCTEPKEFIQTAHK